jgi:hypothetical protein
MMIQLTRMTTSADLSGHNARGSDSDSLLVDSAISHAEKLRRVLELEQWLNSTTPDRPLPLSTRRKWQEQREQLLAELRLEELGAANSPPKDAPGAPSAASTWLQRLLRRLRPDSDS